MSSNLGETSDDNDHHRQSIVEEDEENLHRFMNDDGIEFELIATNDDAKNDDVNTSETREKSTSTSTSSSSSSSSSTSATPKIIKDANGDLSIDLSQFSGKFRIRKASSSRSVQQQQQEQQQRQEQQQGRQARRHTSTSLGHQGIASLASPASPSPSSDVAVPQESYSQSPTAHPSSVTRGGPLVSSFHSPDVPLPSLQPSIHNLLDQVNALQDSVRTNEEVQPDVGLQVPKRTLKKAVSIVGSPPQTRGGGGGRQRRSVTRNHLLRKRMSMRSIANLGPILDDKKNNDGDDDDGTGQWNQNLLHKLCSSPSITVRKMEVMIQRHPDMVRSEDDNGRLPLHVLASNSELLVFPDGQEIAKQCALLLIDAYPNSVVKIDSDDRVPFRYLIEKWVDWVFTTYAASIQQKTAVTATSSSSEKSVKSKISRVLSKGGGGGGGDKRAIAASANPSIIASFASSVTSSSHSESFHHFPPVLIFEEVEWCFEMLSIVMEHLGGKPMDSMQKVRPKLAYSKQRREREFLASNIMSIPNILRAILLLESLETRKKIMESSLIRRCLFVPDAYGPWLTEMLRFKRGTPSEVAIEFIRRISKLCIDDFVGDYRKAYTHDEREFQEHKLAVFEKFESLTDLVPSLLVLKESALDRALSTPIVWFTMNRRITTPFTIVVVSADIKLHLAVIFAFRESTLEKRIFGNSDGDGNDTDVDGSKKSFEWLTVGTVIFFVGLHHITRRICEIVALHNISPKVARKYFFEFWNMVDLIGIILAMWASKVAEHEKDLTHSAWPAVFAIVLGLLWLRVLGFLRAVNEQLATFIVALTKIFVDVRYFFVILLVFLFMFGDMLSIIFNSDENIQCDLTSDDIDPPNEDFCGTSLLRSYIRVYAMIVGDLELENYKQSNAVTALWFVTTLLGSVVLLNVLIAVVSLSYANAQDSSIVLFRRARAQFVASHAAMERFLRPDLADWTETLPKWSVPYISLMFLRWFMMITFYVTIVWTALYLIQGFITQLRLSDIWGMVIFLFLTIIMLYSVISATVFMMFLIAHQGMPECDMKREMLQTLANVDNSLVDYTSKGLGISKNDTEFVEIPIVSRQQQHQHVMDRLEKLEKSIGQLIEHIGNNHNNHNFNNNSTIMGNNNAATTTTSINDDDDGHDVDDYDVDYEEAGLGDSQISMR